MSSPDVLKLAMIKALIENLDDASDEEDAKQALRLIRGLVGESKQS